MNIESAPHGIQYDLPGICYFEAYKDGSVSTVSNSRRSIEDKDEDSLFQSYFRALRGECIIYFTFADNNGNVYLYRVDNLEALADSVGIDRQSDHIHNVRWSYNKDDPGKGRYASLDVKFLCGCELSSLNKRIMAKQLKKQFGWEIILSGINSIPSSKRTIQVERKSIRE